MSRSENTIVPLKAVRDTLSSTKSWGACLLFAGVVTVAAAAQAQTSCPHPAAIRVRQGTSFAAADSARLGHWYLNRKLYSCAAKAFTVAGSLQPNHFSFDYLLGVSLEKGGKVEAALKPLREAARLDPTNAAPRVASGEAFDLLHRRTEAEGQWRYALVIDPSSGAALDGLSNDLLRDKDYLGVVSLLRQGQSKDTLSQTQTLNLGEALALLARLKDAIAVLKDGLQRHPGSASLADEMATVQLLAGQQELAYATLQRVMVEHPGNRATETLYLRALINGNSEKAAPYAEKLIAECPKDAEILYLGAHLAQIAGNFTRAEELVKRSLTANENDYKAQQLYGILLMQSGDLHGSKGYLEKAIALGDPDPGVRYQLAHVEMKLGETADAKNTLQSFMSRQASQKGLINTAEDVARGDEAMRDGQSALAASLYRQALHLSPAEALIHYKLSRALGQLQESSEEWAELQRAVQLDPRFAQALNQMGYLALHGGDAQKAAGYFQAATKASPLYVVAWTNLAAAFASEGKWQQAENAIEQALRLDPGNKTALELKALIADSQSAQ